MIKKLYTPFTYFLLIFIIIFSFELFIRRHTADKYYILRLRFWDLEKFTNLFGQHDDKKELVLYYTIHSNIEKIKVKKPREVTRIIFLGTSSTAGYGVSRKENFVSALQRKLDNYYGEGKFELINAGIPAYTSYQLLIYFKEVLLKLSPDIVVLYSGHNDCDYFGRITDREYYEQVKKIATRIRQDKGKIKKLFKYGLHSSSPFYSFLAESRLFGYLYVKFWLWTKGKINISGPIFRVPPADRQYVLEEFVKLSKRYGFGLVFVPEATNRQRGREMDIDSYHELMKNIARNNCVFVDLKPALRKYPEYEILFDDVHLTLFGHNLVGDNLFEVIRKLYKEEAIFSMISSVN